MAQDLCRIEAVVLRGCVVRKPEDLDKQLSHWFATRRNDVLDCSNLLRDEKATMSRITFIAATLATADPCCTGDVAANAVDGDASTRYSTGAAQAAGQYLQADFGRAIRVRQVVLDTGVSTGDYPRGYTVTTSTDGVSWSTAVASGQGTGQFTTIPLGGAPVRYVRVTLTAASGSWWSVADVRAYAGARG
jgi:F5/8 type C domain-containing protein